MTANEHMMDDPARDDMLILVDENDRETGSASKMDAHVDGLLHRAFSLVLFREGEGGRELLLSKRAISKYHSGGLWANSCCSHPRLGEELLEAVSRRAPEEIGCEVASLEDIGGFGYRAKFPNGLVEHEFDHIVLGRCLGEPIPNPSEASEVRWVGFGELAGELAAFPGKFAVWAPVVLTKAMAVLDGKKTRHEDNAG